MEQNDSNPKVQKKQKTRQNVCLTTPMTEDTRRKCKENNVKSKKVYQYKGLFDHVVSTRDEHTQFQTGRKREIEDAIFFKAAKRIALN